MSRLTGRGVSDALCPSTLNDASWGGACRSHRWAERGAVQEVQCNVSTDRRLPCCAGISSLHSCKQKHPMRSCLLARNPGCNAKHTHRTSGGDARALHAAIAHFTDKGYTVHAFLPRWAIDGGRERRAKVKLHMAQCLHEAIDRGQLHLAPAGVDDDEFVLSFALQMPGALILSNDLYRDHVAKGKVKKAWLDEHLLPFMFVGDALLVPASTALEVCSSSGSTAYNPGSLSKVSCDQHLSPHSSSPSTESLATATSSTGNRNSKGFSHRAANLRARRLVLPPHHARMRKQSRARHGSGPSMRELLARPKQMHKRF